MGTALGAPGSDKCRQKLSVARAVMDGGIHLAQREGGFREEQTDDLVPQDEKQRDSQEEEAEGAEDLEAQRLHESGKEGRAEQAPRWP